MSAQAQALGRVFLNVTGRKTPSFGAGALGRTTLFKIDEMPDFRDHLCVDQKRERLAVARQPISARAVT